LQILKADHQLFVALLIQAQLDKLDSINEEYGDLEDHAIPTSPLSNMHFSMGSAWPPQTMRTLQSGCSDPAYTHFHKRLGKFMTQFLSARGIALPNENPICYQPDDEVFVMVNFNCHFAQTLVTDNRVLLSQDQL
jgi:hypothetical protein